MDTFETFLEKLSSLKCISDLFGFFKVSSRETLFCWFKFALSKGDGHL